LRFFNTTYLNVALEYAIRKVQEQQVELKLNGTHKLLAYADDVNLLGDKLENVKKNRTFN
jgi:methionine synthase II (cobalamin-independent)